MKHQIQLLRKVIDNILFTLSVICTAVIIFHIGYNTDALLEIKLNRALEVCFLFFAFALLIKTITSYLSRSSKIIRYSEALLCLYFFSVTLADSYYFLGANGSHLVRPEWIYLGICAVCVIEVSKKTLFFDLFYFNPTLLFVLSFLLLILSGTALLLLPKSTNYHHLSFLDALFITTSAVCVTGLSVVDIAKEFTFFGQAVLLLLIQLGGLGIMTFTGFFGYFFSGGFSFKNELLYTELLGEHKLGSVMRMIYKIILITFLCELLGAVLIYMTVDRSLFVSASQQVFFSVFHSVSAFCNAGFSTLSDGLHHPAYRFNYPLHLCLILLYVTGGLGFGIFLNLYALTKRWTQNLYRKVFYGRDFLYKARVVSFNSKIIAYTSSILVIAGFVIVWALEYNHTLLEHKGVWGKSVTALFISTSPRTAGFNTFPMDGLAFPTIMVIMLLMWIGAAPGSTGGGIKVTTIALAMLNIASLAKGKDRIELLGRKISQHSVSRALAIITLSLIYLGISIFVLSVTDSDKTLWSLAFESFSAYGTTGLSLGITPALSSPGKLVLILTMFVGRVGALTLLIAMVRKSAPKNYQFPTEQMNF